MLRMVASDRAQRAMRQRRRQLSTTTTTSLSVGPESGVRQISTLARTSLLPERRKDVTSHVGTSPRECIYAYTHASAQGGGELGSDDNGMGRRRRPSITVRLKTWFIDQSREMKMKMEPQMLKASDHRSSIVS